MRDAAKSIDRGLDCTLGEYGNHGSIPRFSRHAAFQVLRLERAPTMEYAMRVFTGVTFLILSLAACETSESHHFELLEAAPSKGDAEVRKSCGPEDLEFEVHWKDAAGRCTTCDVSRAEVVVIARNRCDIDVSFRTDTGCMISAVDFSGKYEDFAYEGGLMCTEALTTHRVAARSQRVHSYPLAGVYVGEWFAAVEVEIDGQDFVDSEVSFVSYDF